MRNLRKIILTGGCGGVGTNIATYLLNKGFNVVSFDNLSSRFSETNILKHKNYSFVHGDIRVQSDIKKIQGDILIHLASCEYYRDNIAGDLNIIELCKEKNIPLILVSSNKVYSNLVDKLPFTEFESRYVLGKKTGEYTKKGKPITKSKVYGNGINETFPIDGLDNYFRTLYGAAKYTGDLFTQEFNYLGLNSTIIRASFIYGRFQYTDWLSKLMISRLLGREVEIDGNGKKVTDALYAEDFSELILNIILNFDSYKSKVFNVGGGCEPSFTVSKIEALNLIDILDQRAGFDNKPSEIKFIDEIKNEKNIYLTDLTKISKYWKPKTTVFTGFEKKYHWLSENINFIREMM